MTEDAYELAGVRLAVHVGDITDLAVDAVVNAANSRLAAGGGVDGAIHRAAGPDLQRYLDAAHDGCPTGDCRPSPGFGLKADHIIHCVGPVWHGGGSGETEQLAGCYRRALAIAGELDVASIAFPAISTGVYGFPADQAAQVAIETVAKVIKSQENGAKLRDVVFVAFGDAAAQPLRLALAVLRAAPIR